MLLRVKQIFWSVVVLGCTWACQSDNVDFNHDVRPVLNKHCLPCHGGVRQQSELSFLFEQDALNPAKSGKHAIIPGNASGSELIKRITSTDPELQMPPEGVTLTQGEIDILTKWIDEGAEWEEHWAYIPPDKSKEIPEVTSDWISNNIDKFVFTRLEAEGLTPAPIASNTSLLRRLSFDLIGLPPTMEDLDSYLEDDVEQAYENQIDRLLESPHFGERWASMWLDLARYADSQGYQKDLLRKDIWRYRDWVINAFNEDKPFDEFTIEQLAGDLIPDATEDQLLATAFHRNTMTNDEGGTDDEEYRVSAVLDRINTTFEIWQSTTVACVQCHSHPYDPIRHKEYYELYAYFNNTLDDDRSNDQPKLPLMSPGQKLAKAELNQEIVEYKAKKDTLSDEYESLVAAFIKIQPGKVQVMQEMPADSSRQSFVFERGNWLVHGEEVSPATPSFLSPWKETYPDNRLGLAQWLVDGDNPMTARVIVNRLWEQIFGIGLVETVEDFGTQGAKPDYQDLLDYLAISLVDNHKWNLKSLLKEIIMSSTYRQSSNVNEALLEKDPYNKLLARGARFRLSAEAIRDQALTVSGLLNRDLFGQSVMPHQPDGVWNIIRHVGGWKKAEDGNQHRRALYTFWRRVSPYPSMMTFDAPSREFCMSRRIRTNTPLQALVTLNDPVYVEASAALAVRAIEEDASSPSKQIDYMYRRVLMKEPDDTKKKLLTDFYEKNLSEYMNQSEAKAVLINQNNNTRIDIESPSFQALTNVANVILNLDETVMKS